MANCQPVKKNKDPIVLTYDQAKSHDLWRLMTYDDEVGVSSYRDNNNNIFLTVSLNVSLNSYLTTVLFTEFFATTIHYKVLRNLPK